MPLSSPPAIQNPVWEDDDVAPLTFSIYHYRAKLVRIDQTSRHVEVMTPAIKISIIV